MTTAKKLKREARARAAKTGESYATARLQLIQSRDKDRAQRTRAAAGAARSAKANGTVSETMCIERTGHGFDHWFAVLDRFGAAKHGHAASAKHLRQEHRVSAWYCQAITVSYERARGLRQVNQLCSGEFACSVSRVLPVDFATALKAVARQGQRAKWLTDDAAEEALSHTRFRTKDDAATVRFDWLGAVVELRISGRDDGRSSVAVDMRKLPDKPTMDRRRAQWRATLDGLRTHLARAGH